MNTIESILKVFFGQVESGDHSTTHYPSVFEELQLNVGFGIGKTANIPWLVFLAEGQTPQHGIFPAFYYFKKQHTLILAYGISEAKRPMLSWRAPLKVQTIEKYFQQRHVKPYKYGQSYVYGAYTTYDEMDFVKITADLNALIKHYKTLFPGG